MMYQVKVNNEMDLTFPENYQVMGEEELTRYFHTPVDRWGAYDPDRHIILSVGWEKAKFMQSDPDMFLHKKEASLRLDLRNYQRITSYKMKIASKKAYGVRFEYRVNDARMVHVADLIALKHKKHFYTIWFVSRKPNAPAVLPELQQILGSVALS